MKKKTESIEDVRTKFLERKKQEAEEEKQQALESGMDSIVYDVIQNPDVKGREFLKVTIKYNHKTKEATVIEVGPFINKAAGLSIIMDKENRKYLFEKK